MSISFEKIGSTPRVACQSDRDHAAIALASYLLGLLKFSPDDISSGQYRDEIIHRITKVYRTQGLKDPSIADAVERIRNVIEAA